MTFNIYEHEQKLCTMLDALADGAKLQTASRAAGKHRNYILNAIKKSEAGNADYCVSWRDEFSRQFCELVPIAKNMGRVVHEQRLRGVAVNGEVQYVQDPALLARFGFDDDAQAMAELSGYKDFPYAHDVDGNKIPLLSTRHPRPQRKHRNSPPRPPVGEQSSDANTSRQLGAAGDHPIRDWRPDDPEPAYSRRVRCAAPPPIVHVPSPASPRVSPLRAELMERFAQLKEHGPANPRPLDRVGRPTMPALNRERVDDPVEHVTGRPTP